MSELPVISPELPPPDGEPPFAPRAPGELPLAAALQPERADAARNRSQILEAAGRLLATRGLEATSMDAIAAAAGVGKGTLFRRFGDRASLLFALLDETERELQDAFLHGPPPLGPGAPASERLIAFGWALLDRLARDGGMLLEIERGRGAGWQGSQPYAAYRLHVRALLEQACPEAQLGYLSDALLAVLSPGAFHHQTQVRGLSLDALKRGFADLVTRLLA